MDRLLVQLSDRINFVFVVYLFLCEPTCKPGGWRFTRLYRPTFVKFVKFFDGGNDASEYLIMILAPQPQAGHIFTGYIDGPVAAGVGFFFFVCGRVFLYNS